MDHFKHSILCADDFGLNPGVSQGILKLVRKQRLSAVSCMVNAPTFLFYAKDLLMLKNQVHTGLHFNLTEGTFLSKPEPCFNLKELIIKSHCRLINTSVIEKEFNAQLDNYIEIMGDLPAFIDGHQHVHQFPIIRETILKVYKQRFKHHFITIRSTYPVLSSPQFYFKAAILSLTGGKKIHTQLKKSNIPHNHYFSGIYDFKPDSDYRALFRHWLNKAPTNTLIMCHPGEGNDADDTIAPARNVELAYFLSDDFLSDCQEYQVDFSYRQAQNRERK